MYYNCITISMPEFDAKLRRVGDSIGLLIPHEVVRELGETTGSRVRVIIAKRVDWSGLWGKLVVRAPTTELIRRARTARD